MRIIFIFAGAALIQKFHFTIYVFGALLIYTGYKMFFHNNTKIEPDKNPVIRFFKRFMPVTPGMQGDKFFVKIDGKRVATPLFLVLILIETTDLIFAADSIPAILAITQDQSLFIPRMYLPSWGCAPLFCTGRRGEPFLAAQLRLAVVLVFVGIKMAFGRCV